MRPNGNNGGNNFNRRPRNNHGNNNSQGGGGNRGGGGGNNIRRPQQPTNLRNQIFDSHGPNGERVRGNAFQVHEKYQSLARDAEERVDQEAYGQHAEHYYRIVEAIQDMEAERSARFSNQPNGLQGGQQNSEGGQGQARQQQGGYQNNQSERNQSYSGDQPDLNSQPQSEDGEAPQQRRGYQPNQANNRRMPYDGQRDSQRDSQANGQVEPQPNGSERQDASPRRQPRGPVHDRAQDRTPLQPIDADHNEADDDSGPIFSLAGDLPTEPVDEVAVAPRRRGRPPKTETAD